MTQEQHPTTSGLPIILAALGITAGVFVLVWLLFPIIVKNSPLGDVIRQSEMAQARSEMASAETALLGLFADAGVERVQDLFDDPEDFYKTTVAETVEHHTKIAYALLREGRSADIGMRTDVAGRLGETYIELSDDPWGNPYQFYFGPWQNGRHEDDDDPPFLSYIDRALNPIPEGQQPDPTRSIYIYNHGPSGLSEQPFAPSHDDTIPPDDQGNWVRPKAQPENTDASTTED